MRSKRARAARKAAFEKAGSGRGTPVGVLMMRLWHEGSIEGVECKSCGADCWCFIPRTWQLPAPGGLRAHTMLIAPPKGAIRMKRVLG